MDVYSPSKDRSEAEIAVERIRELAPALVALTRRLAPEDAELIHRVIQALRQAGD